MYPIELPVFYYKEIIGYKEHIGRCVLKVMVKYTILLNEFHDKCYLFLKYHHGTMYTLRVYLFQFEFLPSS